MTEKQVYTGINYQLYESGNLKKIEFEDKYIAVVIPSKNNKFCVCVSSQAGCPIGCKFCHTKFFERNLSVEEILEQVKVAQELIRQKPSSIVFMGMGEPLLNFENVESAIKKINQIFGVAFDKITISTIGVNIEKYIEQLLKAKYNIAISLHSAFENKRKELIPNSISVKELIKYANMISKTKKNGVMIEYCMIKGVNDTEKDLEKLMSFNWEKNTNFNLIEFNECEDMKKSEKMQKFKEEIRKKRYKCFIRESRGKELKSACGMLNIE
jgi:23S rRNA (adenine2503-C2)-methyltransferase